MSAPRVLFEVYPDRFAPGEWGGIETALWFLGESLRGQGVEVEHFSAAEVPDVHQLEAYVRSGNHAAVFPLADSDMFWRADPLRLPELCARMVRIWHDVGALSPRLGEPTACPRHGALALDEQGVSPCVAAHVRPGGYKADIFLRPHAWTNCFPWRHHIPWAANHLPPASLRDPEGPVVLQVGKLDNEDVQRLVDGCLGSGLAVRLIFSNWTRLARGAKELFASYAGQEGLQSFSTYDIRRDFRQIFGGASCALVLTRFFETFNFLAAEAVQLGIPVVSLSGSGAVSHFSSLELADVPALAALLRRRDHRALLPRPRSDRTWHDVARDYRGLIEEPPRVRGDARPRA